MAFAHERKAHIGYDQGRCLSILDVVGQFCREKSKRLKAIEGSKWMLLAGVSLVTLVNRNHFSTAMIDVGDLALGH
jgi:hypothetical protein